MQLTPHTRPTLLALLVGAALALACGGPVAGGGPYSSQAGALEGDSETEHGSKGKVVICHVPPGNEDAVHAINVNWSAYDTHMEHGDWEYEDEDSCPWLSGSEGGDTGDEGGDTGDEGGDTGGDVPACKAAGESCGEGVGACCSGLTCEQSVCTPVIG